MLFFAAILAGCADARTIDTGLAASDGPTTSVAPTTTVAPDQPVGTTEPPATTPATAPPGTSNPTTAATQPPANQPPANPPPPTPPPPAAGDRHPAGWESFQVGADGRTLVFTYYAGIAPCSVFDSITAVEGPSQVTVTIYERSDVGPDVACIAIAQRKTATVTLDSDLAGRTVVDGGR